MVRRREVVRIRSHAASVDAQQPAGDHDRSGSIAGARVVRLPRATRPACRQRRSGEFFADGRPQHHLAVVGLADVAVGCDGAGREVGDRRVDHHQRQRERIRHVRLRGRRVAARVGRGDAIVVRRARRQPADRDRVSRDALRLLHARRQARRRRAVGDVGIRRLVGRPRDRHRRGSDRRRRDLRDYWRRRVGREVRVEPDVDPEVRVAGVGGEDGRPRRREDRVRGVKRLPVVRQHRHVDRHAVRVTVARAVIRRDVGRARGNGDRHVEVDFLPPATGRGREICRRQPRAARGPQSAAVDAGDRRGLVETDAANDAVDIRVEVHAQLDAVARVGIAGRGIRGQIDVRIPDRARAGLDDRRRDRHGHSRRRRFEVAAVVDRAGQNRRGALRVRRPDVQTRSRARSPDAMSDRRRSRSPRRRPRR